jgi:coproporphyrinogen III oxidase-like Fe-S oxidoreductase
MTVETLIGSYLRRSTALSMNFGVEPLTRPAASSASVLLYIHVPFCEWLCPFCTFHRARFDVDRARHYFAALRSEIRRYHDLGFRFSSVFVGGGTPTVLPDELIRTLDLTRSLGMDGEVSVETNPNHLRPDILAQLRAAGVDRLSVGVQSFDDELLKEMGRYEPYGSGQTIAQKLATVQGTFPTLNADLIFNFPHQSVESLRRDMDIVRDIGIDQVSCYPLMPANETRIAMGRNMGQVDFTREKSLYQVIRETMQPTYRMSSAWSFVRNKSMIDEYISEYDEYLGIGSGSFSYLNGTMYSTSFSITRYIERVARGQTGIVMQRNLAPREQLRYLFLVGLFSGTLSRDRLRTIRGPGARRTLWQLLLFFKAVGAVRRDGNLYRLTDRGLYLWVMMMREFLMGVNRFREQMRHHIKSERLLDLQEVTVPVESLATRPP